MSLTTHSKKLTWAVFLFIVLDVSILAINFSITTYMYEDAVAINLAGRQRMLSQRITKVLLQISPTNTSEQQQTLEKELRLSLNLFFTTLNGFAKGGEVVGGDGNKTFLHAVTNPHSQALIQKAQQHLQPLYQSWQPYITDASPIPTEVLDTFRQQAIEHNLTILGLMNQLTFALEKDSQQRTDLLRIIQTVIFLIALINFIMIIRGMRQQTANAIAMSQHFSHLAIHDPLTGLFNRRHFTSTLSNEMAQSEQPNDKLALIIIDLDGFKPVNDTYGHEAGDEVLKITTQRIKTHARSNDTVSRLGGDEFSIICPHLTTEEAAKNLCHRLLAAIQQPITLSTQEVVKINASMGVSFYPNPMVSSMEELIECTDNAMYQAKQNGRGQFVFATSHTDHA